MRVVLVLGLAASCSLFPGVAGAEDDFSYGDTIVLPRVSPHGKDPDWLARCDYLVRGQASRIWFGYVIEIPPPYQDGLHPFTLVDGLMGFTTGADFDVTFTPDLGTCAEPPTAATRFHNVGDERGIVPAGTRYAIFTTRSPDKPAATFYIEIKGLG